MLEAPELLTTAGVAVALLSAIYAKRSERSAKRQAEAAEFALRETRTQSALAHGALAAAREQNEISLHAHRLNAYRAFLAFEGEVNARATNFSKQAMGQLWQHARIAEFYFPERVSTALGALLDLAVKVGVQAERANDPQAYSLEELEEVRDKRDALYFQMLDHMDKIGQDMRVAMKLVRSEA